MKVLPQQPAVVTPGALMLVASADAAAADGIAAQLRQDGAIAYSAHSWHGCMRVATSVGPATVLLDPSLPSRLEGLLRAHPRTAGARVVRLSADTMHRARG